MELILMTSVVALIFAIAVKIKYDEEQLMKKYARRNNREWGKIPDADYTDAKLNAIKEYYLANQGKEDVDDITWNDLDMDSIFMLLNNTQSNMGEDYLYATLRKLQTDSGELEKKENLISYLQEHNEERNQLQTRFRLMGKVKGFSLYKYMNMAGDIPIHSPIASILMCSSLVISVILVALSVFNIISPIYGIIMMVICVINNVINYFRRKDKIKNYFQVFKYIIRILENAKNLTDCGVPHLDQYFARINELVDGFKDFKRGAFLVFIDSKRGEGSFFDIFLDYFRMLFHLDLIKFDSMVKKVHGRIDELNELYDLLGYLDSTVAIASFRAYLEEEGYCIPDLHTLEQPRIVVMGGYHPLIDEPVKNGIYAENSVLITGSNASGKSTFIRMMAICAILAQTVHTVPASKYEGSYFRVLSSMALTDNLKNNESYYIVEIKSLKRILNKVDDTLPTLCFVDEVLRGTNTIERIAASAQILNSLSESNAICFAATHDLELTHILEKQYDNYHFQEEVVEKEVLFDYVLYESRANSRNAIKLLGMMGYDESIIDKAEAMASDFVDTGIWKSIN